MKCTAATVVKQPGSAGQLGFILVFKYTRHSTSSTYERRVGGDGGNELNRERTLQRDKDSKCAG
jgi:hypothetical protein